MLLPPPVQDGQINLTFEGSWTETTMWELYAATALMAEDGQYLAPQAHRRRIPRA